MQFKIRLLVIAFYTLSIALLWFVKLQACRSYCYTWYGMLPAQVGSCMCFLYFTQPWVLSAHRLVLLACIVVEHAWQGLTGISFLNIRAISAIMCHADAMPKMKIFIEIDVSCPVT